jgi:hypothetical protein
MFSKDSVEENLALMHFFATMALLRRENNTK